MKLAKSIQLKYEKEDPNPLPRNRLEVPPIKRVEKPEDIEESDKE
jgi:hypothetical protein